MNYVIAGPPGSGKTTLAHKRAQYGDAIVDVDALFAALSGQALYAKPVGLLPVVAAARDAAVARIAQGIAGDAYVITADGQRATHNALRERLDAELIVLEVDAETCKARLLQDNRRDADTDWPALVDAWWRDYGASAGAQGRLRLLRLAEEELCDSG